MLLFEFPLHLDLTEEQVDLFRLVDNKSSEYAGWDYDRLSRELSMIDMSLAPNELMVGMFDFDIKPAEFENVPTAIPISTFNFMGDDFKRGKVRQAPVATPADDEEESKYETIQEVVDATSDQIARDTVESGTAIEYGEKKKGISSVIHTFRCGNHRFVISELEEERMIEAYTRYMSEVYPETTFIKFLLGGTENAEV